MEQNEVLSVKKFELTQKCKNAYGYSLCFEEPCRPFVLYDLIRKVCEDLKRSPDFSDATWYEYYNSYREFLESRYLEEWFELPWQRGLSINQDVDLIRRFVTWFGDLGAQIVALDLVADFEGRDVTIRQNVQMVYKVGDMYYAALIHSGKTKKSLNGKSAETNIRHDLASMVVKNALEEEYPKISVCNIFLQTEADKEGEVGTFFMIDTTKKSQFFSVGYENYYDKDGTFLKEDFESAIKAAMEKQIKKDCTFCPYKDVCPDETIFSELKRERKGKEEVLKKAVEYTEKQSEAIRKEGPTAIIACPGSGKTATLVGKIKYLKEVRKVAPPLILMLAFTNEAVETMKKRVLEFCPEYNCPTITTINGLAFGILSDHRKSLGLAKNEILTDNALKEIIYTQLLSVRQLDRINLKNSLTGRYGLLNTLMRYYKAYMEVGEEEFFAPGKHADCGVQLREFIRDINRVIEDRQFITFDEQITLCLKLLKENPDVLNTYRSMYQYILVDEFQDVNKEQAELIYLLAAPKNEITVVGDEDQSIYGWRGGDRTIMLSFPKRYGITPIVLNQNFRSLSGLAKAADKVISLQCAERIAKKVDAKKKSDEKPLFIQNNDPETVERIIHALIKEGYRYGDIVLLARTNAELTTFKEKLSVPSILGKNYLIQNPLFRFLFNLLSYYKTDKTRYLIELFFLFDLKEYALSFGKNTEILKRALKHPGEENKKALLYLGEIIDDMKDILLTADTIKDNFDFVFQSFCGILGIPSDSPFAIAINNLCDLYQIRNVEEFYKRAKSLRDFGDETKMNTMGDEDSILLLTMHEAKGMEFPVVIVVDDGKTNYTEDPEGLNLLYVSLTRPEKKCLFLSKRLLPCFGDDIFERVAI